MTEHHDGLPARLTHVLRDTPATRTVLLAALSLIRRIAWAPAGVYTLCYHHVAAAQRRNFERQLDYFARYGTFIGADRAIALLASGKVATGRYFVASFDDGYADLIDVALPALAERAIPAIAFIVDSWLNHAPTPAAERVAGYMSLADLETWCRYGMDVGSHTHSHAHMASLSDDAARDELRCSSAALAKATGAKPRHFACPWGVPGRDFIPARAQRLAQSAGYASLFTTTRGVATGASDVWQMPRHVIEPEWPLREADALIGALPLGGGAFGNRRSWNKEQCRSSS